jgi:hypothetical protein
MARSNRTPKGRKQRNDILKLPEPPTEAQLLQAQIDALDLPLDEVQCKVVADPQTGAVVETTITLTPKDPHSHIGQIAADWLKQLTIKPYTPEKDTVTVDGVEMQLVRVGDAIAKKPWTKAERHRRSKPKPGDPDLPSR